MGKAPTTDCKILSSPDTLQVFTSLEYEIGIHDFRPTRIFLIIKILTTQKKFLKPPDYSTVNNFAFTLCTTNVFGCFGGVMVQFELVMHILD